MKVFRRSISGVSLALLFIQLTLVSIVAGEYEYQQWRCPRVWVRTYGFDPQLPLRGRYFAFAVPVDGCGSTLPSGAQAQFPRDVNGAAIPGPYFIRGVPEVRFRAELRVQNNRLQAIRIPDTQQQTGGQMVSAWPGKSCHEMTLDNAVSFYVPENAPRLYPLGPGEEIWIELTIPPQGAPRPMQLALKDHGAWKPLRF